MSKKIITIAITFLQPLIIPILTILIFLVIVSSITDILYIAFNNDDKIDMKKELAYYDISYDKDNDKQEVKGFFASVWGFISNIFGGMSDETDWPVERILFNK